jgi:DNA-binding NarL/FixJ family response regulator
VKCLETRRTPDGLRRRRYSTADGARTFSTVEVPASVLYGITSRARLRERLKAWSRRQEALDKRERALQLVDAGWKPVAVAHELGLAVRTIERWRAQREED